MPRRGTLARRLSGAYHFVDRFVCAAILEANCEQEGLVSARDALYYIGLCDICGCRRQSTAKAGPAISIGGGAV